MTFCAWFAITRLWVGVRVCVHAFARAQSRQLSARRDLALVAMYAHHGQNRVVRSLVRSFLRTHARSCSTADLAHALVIHASVSAVCEPVEGGTQAVETPQQTFKVLGTLFRTAEANPLTQYVLCQALDHPCCRGAQALPSPVS